MSFLTMFCVSDSIFCLITTFLHFIRLEMKDAHEKFKVEICICRLARFGCRLLFGGKRSENDIRERSETCVSSPVCEEGVIRDWPLLNQSIRYVPFKEGHKYFKTFTLQILMCNTRELMDF